MKSREIVILFLCIHQVITRRTPCKPDEELCKDECHDPNRYDCLEDKVCWKGQRKCQFRDLNATCYDPDYQVCTKLGTICPLGQESCGTSTTCYNPEAKTCFTRPYHQPTLCNIGEVHCAGQCYNAATARGKVCSSDGAAWCNIGEANCNDKCYAPDSGAKCHGGHTLCQAGEEMCGFKCYDRESGAKCYGGHTLCQAGEELCGHTCYLPESGAKCFSDQIVCQAGEEICSTKCYHPKSGAKCHGGVTLCQSGELNCKYKCYTKESGAKCYGGHTLCQAGEENCGHDCFDPKTESCFNNKKACRSTREPCGDSICYWPHNETCYEGRKFYRSISCPKSLSPCGDKCYDPDDRDCLKYGNGIETLCLPGFDICGQTCYIPSDENKCVKGVVCKIDEEACGRKCYNPKLLGEHFGCYRKEPPLFTGFRAGTVPDFEYLTCAPGYDLNFNGDCQRTIRLPGGEQGNSNENEVESEQQNSDKNDMSNSNSTGVTNCPRRISEISIFICMYISKYIIHY